MDKSQEDTHDHTPEMLDLADTDAQQLPPRRMISNITIDENTDVYTPATILHLEGRSTPLPVAFNDASITNPSSMVSMQMAQKADDVQTRQHLISTPQTPS
jgi:hypothetical protein